MRHELTAQRFGRWLVVSKAASQPYSGRIRSFWHCRCMCGTTRDIPTDRLVSGGSQGCGCERSERRRKRTRLYICSYCQRKFRRPMSRAAQGKSKFCSNSCLLKWRRSRPVNERFWNKVLKTPGCWIWVGSISKTAGYGWFRDQNKSTQAHRVAYRLTHNLKSLPGNTCVLHRCDNRICVRPDHLFLGTARDNVADMVKKGRQARGERNRHAKLTAISVRGIRALVKNGIATAVVAKQFHISRNHVVAIKNRVFWRHLAPS